MFIVLIRTIFLYLLVLVTMRIMGKRQLGQLEPFELVVTIMISELASLPMQDTKLPLIHGVIPIITLLSLEVLISFIELKFDKSRYFFTGKQTVLIKKGVIQIKEMREQKFNLDDLLENLRINGYFDIDDIEYAILETSGQLSILPKSNHSPIVKEDMKINSPNPILPCALILDRKLIKTELISSGKNEEWLKKKLKENGVKSYDDVFLAMLSSKGEFVMQKYEGGEKK